MSAMRRTLTGLLLAIVGICFFGMPAQAAAGDSPSPSTVPVALASGSPSSNPAAVQNITWQYVDATSAQLSWQQPANVQPGTTTHYIVTVEYNNDPDQQDFVNDTTTTSVVFHNIQPGWTAVPTVNDRSQLQPDPDDVGPTWTQPSVKPGAPTAVTLTSVNNNSKNQYPQLTTTWAAPASNGGSPVTSYTVSTHMVVKGKANQVESKTVPMTVTSVTFSKVDFSKTYYVTVSATNAKGTGPTAKSSTVKTNATGADPNPSPAKSYTPAPTPSMSSPSPSATHIAVTPKPTHTVTPTKTNGNDTLPVILLTLTGAILLAAIIGLIFAIRYNRRNGFPF